MKRLGLILFLVILQAKAFGANSLTPVINAQVQHSPIDKLSIRLRQQNVQIQRDLKAGKLTKDQAKALKAQRTKGSGHHYPLYKEIGFPKIRKCQDPNGSITKVRFTTLPPVGMSAGRYSQTIPTGGCF
jgi:hypothetical protein